MASGKGAQVAMRRQQADRNDRVQTGERVPYVVVHQQTSHLLRESAQPPEVMLFANPHAIGIDGRPRGEWPRDVMVGSLALVDQDIFLFGGSVRDNLCLWDETITDGAIVRAECWWE